MNFGTAMYGLPANSASCLMAGVVLFILSAVMRLQDRALPFSIVPLGLASLIIAIGFALIDPFLHQWDELYHALVAKNMVSNPFKPMLYAHSVYPKDLRHWTGSEIWLHKQPLFMWLMALSIKLIGVSPFAVRMPSAILHGLLTIIICRLGKIAVNERVGWMAAAMFTTLYFPLELLTGAICTDHNDTAFLFFVTASIWAWAEYQQSRKWQWAVVVGLFCGMAVLVKWLSGLLVLGAWGLAAIIQRDWKTLPHLALAVGAAVVVALPWQLHILTAFPEEAKYEYALNSRHLVEAVEGHGGDIWFHWDALEDLYGHGDAVRILLLLGIVALMFRAGHLSYRLVLPICIVTVFGVFTYAATKMTAFTLIVGPLLFVGLAALIEWPFALITQKYGYPKLSNVLLVVVTLLAAHGFLDFDAVVRKHGLADASRTSYRAIRTNEVEVICNLPLPGPDSLFVLLNANHGGGQEITTMFYREVTAAYSSLPEPGIIDSILSRGLTPVCLYKLSDGIGKYDHPQVINMVYPEL